MTTEELYRKFESLTVEMCVEEKHDILQCAAIMMAQSMRIYRNALTEDDYHVMIKTVLEGSNDIEKVESPTLQ